MSWCLNFIGCYELTSFSVFRALAVLGVCFQTALCVIAHYRAAAKRADYIALTLTELNF